MSSSSSSSSSSLKKRKIPLHDVIDLCDDDDDDEDVTQSQSAQADQYCEIVAKAERKPNKPTQKAPPQSFSTVNSKKQRQEVNVTPSTSVRQSSGASSVWEGGSFQLATYNVWFGDPYPEERMAAISQNLMEVHTAESPLLFIGLQEVTRTLSRLLSPFLASANYNMIYQPFQAYGLAMAIHQDCTIVKSAFVPFQNTVMDRGMLYAIARLPRSQSEILVFTTHLESYLKPTWTGVSQRQDQVKEMKKFCDKCMKDRPAIQLAVFMGDLNWDDERPRASKGTDVVLSSLLTEPWKDAWRETHPQNDYGYTYDARLNPMLRGALRRRFDRCLLRPKYNVTIEETKLVGQQQLPGLVWKKQYEKGPGNIVVSDREVCASDHFGLVVKLKLAP